MPSFSLAERRVQLMLIDVLHYLFIGNLDRDFMTHFFMINSLLWAYA